MSVIPFGAVGAIASHFALDQHWCSSRLGLNRLVRRVVNASLVLVDYANRQQLEGHSAVEAILRAATLRFRPIILTSVTTFVGLIPLMSTSTPATAPFLPMAISLAWGVLFATVITLILVPCLYIIIEDFGFSRAKKGPSAEEPENYAGDHQSNECPEEISDRLLSMCLPTSIGVVSSHKFHQCGES